MCFCVCCLVHRLPLQSSTICCFLSEILTFFGFRKLNSSLYRCEWRKQIFTVCCGQMKENLCENMQLLCPDWGIFVRGLILQLTWEIHVDYRQLNNIRPSIRRRKYSSSSVCVAVNEINLKKGSCMWKLSVPACGSSLTRDVRSSPEIPGSFSQVLNVKNFNQQVMR